MADQAAEATVHAHKHVREANAQSHNVFDGCHRLGAAQALVEKALLRNKLVANGDDVPEDLRLEADIGDVILKKGLIARVQKAPAAAAAAGPHWNIGTASAQ
jgi:hypothetical protein